MSADEEAEFLARLRERFAQQGVTTLVDWDGLNEQKRLMYYGPCSCGQAYGCRSTWTLEPDGRINGQIACLCPNGHSMDDEVIPVPDVSSWDEDDDGR